MITNHHHHATCIVDYNMFVEENRNQFQDRLYIKLLAFCNNNQYTYNYYTIYNIELQNMQVLDIHKMNNFNKFYVQSMTPQQQLLQQPEKKNQPHISFYYVVYTVQSVVCREWQKKICWPDIMAVLVFVLLKFIQNVEIKYVKINETLG